MALAEDPFIHAQIKYVTIHHITVPIDALDHDRNSIFLQGHWKAPANMKAMNTQISTHLQNLSMIPSNTGRTSESKGTGSLKHLD
jgi:hypothetical protein